LQAKKKHYEIKDIPCTFTHKCVLALVKAFIMNYLVNMIHFILFYKILLWCISLTTFQILRPELNHSQSWYNIVNIAPVLAKHIL
jgi:hypothetical protein